MGLNLPQPSENDSIQTELSNFFIKRSPGGSHRWSFLRAVERMNRTSAGEQGKPGELVGAKGPAGSQDLLPGGTISNRIESLRTATKTALKKSLRPAKARLERELNRVSGNLKGQLDSANRIIAEQAVSLVAAREALLHLDARLMALEDRLEAGASVDRALDRRIPVPVLSDWAPTILGYLELVGGTTTKLLHVNSGDGGLALLLQQKGLEVVAVDPDASCVWSALERGVRAHLSDAFTFLEDPAGPSFDSIIMSGVVDVGSIEDRALLATYALRRLHPGGMVVVATCDKQDWSARVDPRLKALCEGIPIEPNAWIWLLQAVGFDDVVVHSVGDTNPPPSSLGASLVIGWRRA